VILSIWPERSMSITGIHLMVSVRNTWSMHPNDAIA